MQESPPLAMPLASSKGIVQTTNAGVFMHGHLIGILQRLDRIEEAMLMLVQRQSVKEWYTTAEAAKILGKAEFTVREWARNSRIHAEKKGSGRGRYQSWVVSHAELQRIQREGLLPITR